MLDADNVNIAVVTPEFRRHQDLGANIITKCAGTKFHTYDDSWYKNECHIFTIYRNFVQNK
jgi:rubredoxin